MPSSWHAGQVLYLVSLVEFLGVLSLTRNITRISIREKDRMGLASGDKAAETIIIMLWQLCQRQS